MPSIRWDWVSVALFEISDDDPSLFGCPALVGIRQQDYHRETRPYER